MIEIDGNTIRISKGDSAVISFRFETPVPAGKTLIFSVSHFPGKTILIEKSITTTEGAVQAITLSDTDTAMKPGNYVWDIRILDSVADTVTTPVKPSPFIVVPVVGDAEVDDDE